MAFFEWGNRTLQSTTLNTTTNPTTAALLAEIDSTALDGVTHAGGQMYQVVWIVGASTAAIFKLEQALSTGLDMSTAGRSQTLVFTGSGQSAEFITKHMIEVGDRLRCHLDSSFTGSAGAKIIAEPLG